jgi:hypothetical protein
LIKNKFFGFTGQNRFFLTIITIFHFRTKSIADFPERLRRRAWLTAAAGNPSTPTPRTTHGASTLATLRLAYVYFGIVVGIN